MRASWRRRWSASSARQRTEPSAQHSHCSAVHWRAVVSIEDICAIRKEMIHREIERDLDLDLDENLNKSASENKQSGTER